MIIDLNILKRMGKRFGVWPISKLDPKVQHLLTNPEHFIKAPAGFEPLITGGGYEWDDELNGYRLGAGQKMFLLPNGIAIWVFKDAVARALPPDSIQKWVSADEEYPNGKANAFFQIYGHLTSQDLGQNETAGDNVADGEQDADAGGGVATADDESGPEFSKSDVQKMLAGDWSPAGVAGPKASMASAIPTSKEPEPEPQDPEASFAPPKGGGPPPSRAKAGEPKPVDKSAAIISTILKAHGINPKAKPSKQQPLRLKSDEIIDIWKRAKEELPPEDGEKLMAWLKKGMSDGSIQQLNEEKMARAMLETLVRGVVRGIVQEVKEAKKKAKAKKDKKESPEPEPEEPSHSQMDWEPSAERPQQPEKQDHGKWLVAIANKLWKDPMEIGHGQYSWRVRKTVEHPEGPVYLLQKSKQVTDTRVFANRNGRWFWFNPDERPIENRKWHELDMVHPSDEPSIEQEQSTTAAAAPVTGPNAFRKKGPMEEGDEADAAREAELDALWNRALDRLMKGPPKAKKEKKPTKDRSGKIFVKGKEVKLENTEEDPWDLQKMYNKPRQRSAADIKAAKDKFAAAKSAAIQPDVCPKCASKGQKVGGSNRCPAGHTWVPKLGPPRERTEEGQLDEMTTTSGGGGSSQGTTGYSIPGAWVGEKGPGGSDAGIKGSEKLGYTLTAIGKQDMKKHGDKMLQESFQDDSFRRAQAAYDRQLPPEGPGEIECPECGGPGFYRYQSNRGSSRYEWEAECESCGNVWGDAPEPEDNLQAETAMGDLGPKFAAAQRAYDAQTPPDEPPMIDCPKCGEQEAANYIPEKCGRKGSNWWWEAQCTKCGEKFGGDNF